LPGPGFQIAAAYRFAEQSGLTAEAEKIRAMPIHPSISRGSAVRKGALIELLERKGVMAEFIDHHWPNRHTPAGERRRATFLQRLRLNERRLTGEDPGSEDPDANDGDLEAEVPSSFALEAHLRDYLARNLNRIQVGNAPISLYKDSTGRSGIEYPTAVGPIDILAVDTDGNFFVFELKVGRGPDRAMGQLTRYMGWVKLELANNKSVRGIVVANSIDPKLRYSAAVMPNTLLLEYELDFKIRGVAPMESAVAVHKADVT
jgi:hypothetical protein